MWMHSLPDSQEPEKVTTRKVYVLSGARKEITVSSNDSLSQGQTKPNIAGEVGMITMRVKVNEIQMKE